jgi:membrane fusion protein, peptide pheromone/bacteriocin exporter
MLLGPAEITDTTSWWLPPMRRQGFVIYWIILSLFLALFLSLFFIQVDLSVVAAGMIRPMNERTDIKAPVSGRIDSLYFKEGDQVRKNNAILSLFDPSVTEKQRLNDAQIIQCRIFRHDLLLLTEAAPISNSHIQQLQSQVYKEAALKFLSGLKEQHIMLAKARYEMFLNQKLARESVISPKELYDIQMQEQKTAAACESFRRGQISVWQADLSKNEMELKEYYSRREELSQLHETNQIKAPVSGCLQELNGHYAGSFVQAGEFICSISPDGPVIGECYIPQKDIGMLRIGQQARFQLDAFDYNYFGVMTGHIYAIDQDFVLMDKMPVYKIRCRLDGRRVRSSGGLAGIIKKGMGFRVRFITCSKSLWQLLYGGIKERLNPFH